jgi:hypothetical protein
MQQVKALPAPETKQEKEARLSMQHSAVSIPAPVDTDENEDRAADHLLPPGSEVVVPDMVHENLADHPSVRFHF